MSEDVEPKGGCTKFGKGPSCSPEGGNCPVVKRLVWAMAVIVFVLGLYLPWLNGEVHKVSKIETKLDMVLMILKGEVLITKAN